MTFTKWDIVDIKEGNVFLEGLEDIHTKETRDLVVTISE